jgi:TonB family protein
VTADQAVGLGKVRYLVSARITKEGAVEDAKVVDSKAPEFDREVAAAVSQWKFSPALLGETPVEVKVVVPVEVDFSKAQEKFFARW